MTGIEAGSTSEQQSHGVVLGFTAGHRQPRPQPGTAAAIATPNAGVSAAPTDAGECRGASNAAPMATGDDGLFTALNGIPQVDFPRNLQLALAAGRRMSSILAEVVVLRRGPGKLTPNEYFYYRLWEPHLTRDDQRRFVGKQAQQPMHIACNDTGWYAAAADKLLFHTLMAGAGLPTPELLAVAGPGRLTPSGPVLPDADSVARFLRNPRHYPLFAKPINGKYSIAVISADAYDPETDSVLQQGGLRTSVAVLAETLAGRPAGYMVQRRMAPDPRLSGLFGPRLWSVRLLVLLMADGPVIHRAVVKIATGDNPADNFWRHGNMVGAVDLASGDIGRVVQGTGAEMVVGSSHPDTGIPITGIWIPRWAALTALAVEAAKLLPAIRTQSWDIALTDAGPVPLEVNFGGDLNLAQLASGAGVLDERYRGHLHTCGYRL